MRFANLILATVLLTCAALVAQDREQQEPRGQQKQEQQQQQQTQKPTLGPATEPSLYGPRTSTTNDPRKLLRVRTIYVERIDNMLSEKLTDGLSKMGRFRIVASRSEADAVLRGTCFDSRRLKSVHSEVYLTDRGGASIWQDSVRHPYNPPSLQKVVDNTAMEVLQHLGESLREADRKP